MCRANLVTPSPITFQIGSNFVRFYVDVIVDFMYCEIIVFSSFFIIIFLFFIQVKPLKMFPITFSRIRSNQTLEQPFFFTMTWGLTKIESFGWYSQRVNRGNTTSPTKIVYLPIQRNSLWGLNLEYSGIQLILNLQTTRLHFDGSKNKIFFLKYFHLMKIFYIETNAFNHRIANSIIEQHKKKLGV